MKHLILTCAVLVSGCVSLPDDRGVPDVQSYLSERSKAADTVQWGTNRDACVETAKAIGQRPFTADLAVNIAFACSPRMRMLYSKLTLTQAEVFEATRLSNPSLDFVRLSTGSPSDIVNTTWSVSLRFSELLLLPARQRLGKQQLLASQQQTAHEVLQLERDIRSAFVACATTRLIADTNELAANAAALSAKAAEEFRAAGNISELQLSREQAAAVEAEVAWVRAQDDSVKARAALFTAMGLAFQKEAAAAIDMSGELPLPRALLDEPALLLQAAQKRLDVQAARERWEFTAKQGESQTRWRWLDSLEAGYQNESETGLQTRSGPRASLPVPIFHWNKGRVLKAEGQIDASKSALDQLEIELRNDSWSSLSGAMAAHRTASTLRERLVPLRARITELSQREFNYMFIGTFELLSVKREELNAYVLYLRAVQNEWLAQLEVQRVAGGLLPPDLIANNAEGVSR